MSCISASKGFKIAAIALFIKKNKDDIQDSMQVILMLRW